MKNINQIPKILQTIELHRKGKTHYIRKWILVKEYEEGELKTIDVECINGRLLLKRIFLKIENSFGFHIPSQLFMKLGRVNLLLRSYDLKKNSLLTYQCFISRFYFIGKWSTSIILVLTTSLCGTVGMWYLGIRFYFTKVGGRKEYDL